MHDMANRLQTSANMFAGVDDAGIAEAGDRGAKALARLGRVARKRNASRAGAVSTCANAWLRPRREKVFGPPPERHLDRNAKARIWAAAAAYNVSQRRPGQHQGPLTWATLRVLRVLLFRFHGADGGGRCFPAYEKLAAAAKCARSSVAVALHALEETGLLTWVHRLARQRRHERECDLAEVAKTAGTAPSSENSPPCDRVGTGVKRTSRSPACNTSRLKRNASRDCCGLGAQHHGKYRSLRGGPAYRQAAVDPPSSDESGAAFLHCRAGRRPADRPGRVGADLRRQAERNTHT
jgi:hypothetical protein